MFASACKLPKYFFDAHPSALDDLRAEVLSWMRTPYRHFCGVKGKGVDCIHFLARCLEAINAGQGKVFIVPWYSKDWHLHAESEPILMNGVTKQVPGVFVQRSELRDGDIVLMKFGHHISHCGINLDGYVYQALAEYGVDRRKMAPVCFKHVYRITKI
jgi:hypothetical protein